MVLPAHYVFLYVMVSAALVLILYVNGREASMGAAPMTVVRENTATLNVQNTSPHK